MLKRIITQPVFKTFMPTVSIVDMPAVETVEADETPVGGVVQPSEPEAAKQMDKE